MTDTLNPEALLPCPFCGGEAGFEEIAGPTINGTSWTVGCTDVTVDCIGWQMLASFARKSEAAAAWNTRAALPRTDLVERLSDVAKLFDAKRTEDVIFDGTNSQKIAALLRQAAAVISATGGVPDGWHRVPWMPTEPQWSGLARDIVMWMDCHPGSGMTPRNLFDHLECIDRDIPQWLRDEPELKHLDHVPSKGTRATIIYKAMLAAAPPHEEPNG